MIEPEMAFYDLEMNMDLAEDMLKSIVADILKNYSQELSLLERDTSSLEKLIEKDFIRITYDDSVDILTSEKTAQLLDELIQQRESEKEKLVRNILLYKKNMALQKNGEKAD